MLVNFEITESSDWNFKQVLKITPTDAESGFQLGRLFEQLHTQNKKCSAILNGCNILIPLVERNEYNLPVMPKDDDEPPF
jgi:hypothetical protein